MLIYHHPTKKFVISASTIEHAAFTALFAIKQIRLIAKLPLEPYERLCPLSEADHAQKAIIDAYQQIGIDLGAQWGNEIDLREKP